MAETQDTIFRLPDLGEGLQDAEIVAWHVAEGDHVAADQPLVSVETDKAVVEIPAPRSGRIGKLLGAMHERLPIGAPLVAFAADGGADPGSVVGELENAAPAAVSMPEAGAGHASGDHDAGGARRVRAAPAVRAMATELGIDLATLAGSGTDGEISRDDVRGAASSPGMVPLRGIRHAMALRMAESGAAVVPATVTEEADIEAWPPHAPIQARLIAALIAGCQAEPSLNAAFDGKRLARRLNTDIHIGIAVDTEDGLLVPVLRDAQALSPDAVQTALDTLKEAARTRRVAPDTLRGATISLSNFGPLGGLHASLVVVPPQVAILGAGRIVTRVVAEGLGFTEHRILPLSLTFDHRAVSGGEAARFLTVVKTSLENPTDA